MERKIALVSGVSRLMGIGRAICIELAKNNFDIFFSYWTPYDLERPWKIEANEPLMIQEEILRHGVRCQQLELDLSEKNSYTYLFDEVESKLGHPHVLINNATYSTSTNIENITVEEFDKYYNVNIRATTLLTIEFIKRFKFKEDGRIINLSSGQTLGPMPEEIAYAITKGAIETLTTTLSSEIASKGITINSVNPGPNDTGWMNEKMKEELQKQFPMNRIGTPQDTANLIGFLVSKKAEWITGQIMHSEGGFKR